jgi:beta-lactamase regulating signal transducer with metallopeptidase domain
MHPLLASTALGLIAAWPVGALGFGLGRLVERLTDDPRPPAAAWSLAHALPAGALAATVALTFAPAPKPQVAPPSAPVVIELTGPVSPAPATTAPVAAPASVAWAPPPQLAEGLAWSLVGLSAAGLLARGWRWNRGRRRLAAARAAAQPCQDYALIDAVRARAARLGVKAPRVRISPDVGEPLLAGARRPVILLPKALAEATDARRLELVCGHELAHLRRHDNWRIPVEEALAGLFWMAPPVAALRGRMLAAREAVCDLTALDGAAPEARRDYARVLVEALRINALPAPQSAFTGRDRGLARMRLSAILQPRSNASAVRVGVALALGGLLTAATGWGSLALADQARRLAPPQADLARIREDRQASEAARAVAATDAAPAEETRALAAIAADAAPMQAEAAEPAPLTAPVPDLAPPAPAKPVAPMSSLSPVAPLPPAPMPSAAASLSPLPDPHPNPTPNPKPNPRPNPQPSARVARDIEVDVDQEQARIEIRADQQQRAADKTIYLGDVTVRGLLNPVLVNLKVNGRLAPIDFTPANLAPGMIERLEVTPRDMSVDKKMTVNVVLKTATR